MSGTSAAELRAGLRSALTAAMKARDKSAVIALRSALGALDNAEAADATDTPEPTSTVFGGAVVGLGAGEVMRRELTADDVRAIVRAEVDERTSAADAYAAHGQHEAADQLRVEAGVLEAWLG